MCTSQSIGGIIVIVVAIMKQSTRNDKVPVMF